MTDATAVLWLVPVIIVSAALILGPLPIVARGYIRAMAEPNTVRRWYRYVTLGLGIGMAGAVGFMGLNSHDLGLNAAILCILLLLASIDWMWRWLPIEWTLALIALGIFAGLQAPNQPMVLMQMAIPAGALLIARQIMLWATKKETLGLGDVWLVAGLGAFLSSFQCFLVIGFAALSGLAEIGLRRLRGGDVAQMHGVSYGTHLCIIFVIMRYFTPIG